MPPLWKRRIHVWTACVTEPLNICLADVAEAAFYLCAYEFAIRSVKSPWCELFDEDDAKVGDSDQIYLVQMFMRLLEKPEESFVV